MKRVHVSSSAKLFAISFGALLGVSAAQAAVNISDGPTKHMSCSAGVCSPTRKGAVLNVNDLANMLQASDVKVTTGSGAVTIEITAGLSWASTNRLTLDANCSVSIKAPVTVAGPGGLSIVTNDGGTDCDFLFFPGGKVDFWDLSSSLLIDGNSYILTSAIEELAAAIKSNRSGAFALAADYDASGHKFKRSPIHTKFFGQFEGLGHSIENLSIRDDTGECVGLFEQIGDRHHSASIRNIALKSAYVTSSVQFGSVGTLVGCYAGTISNASAQGRVIANGNAGGLAGVDLHGFVAEIERSHADVEVSTSGGFADAGGLVGFGEFVRWSYATGSVTATGYYPKVGGLAGECVGCYQDFATGAVTSSGTIAWGVGGLIGVGRIVEDSYASGTVIGPDSADIGGFVGDGEDDVIASYSIGNASGGSSSFVGGFVGRAGEPNIDMDYWDMETSDLSVGCGEGTCTGVTGLTDAQLKSGLPTGFDPAIWGQDASINNGYPYLLANPPP